ncbi:MULTISPECIES: hypothetical protein [unclassified Streptomyces]|uniref:hypothetical protein n=1 Tax=unclassified Streptomyces TaxID=2593676 RepID=UPI0036E608B7
MSVDTVDIGGTEQEPGDDGGDKDGADTHAAISSGGAKGGCRPSYRQAAVADALCHSCVGAPLHEMTAQMFEFGRTGNRGLRSVDGSVRREGFRQEKSR